MSKKDKNLKKFYDPHPGFGGAIVPLPSKIKQVADWLNGKRLSINVAVKKIKKATGVHSKVEVKDGWICLWIGNLNLEQGKGPLHTFKVISFKDTPRKKRGLNLWNIKTLIYTGSSQI